MSKIVERPRQTAKIHYSDMGSTREYGLIDFATQDDAAAAIFAYSPAIDTVAGIPRFRESIDIKEHGGGCWDAVAHYSKNPNSMEISFDMGSGNTIKAKISKETTASYDCVNGQPGSIGLYYPDFKRGIAFNGKDFDGFDVEQAKFEITISKKLKYSTLDPDYLKTVYGMLQTCNDDDFSFVWKGQNFDFSVGTLRLRGIRMKQDSDDNMDLQYVFLYAKNTVEEDNFTVGDSEPIVKYGHEILWIFYQNSIATASSVGASWTSKKPVAAYVERVYDYSDFTQLQL